MYIQFSYYTHHIWTNPNISKQVWIYLNISEQIQTYQTKSEHIWTNTNISKQIWTYPNKSKHTVWPKLESISKSCFRITRLSFCSHVNKAVLSKGILTHCALNKLAGPFLFSPLGPRCVSCQKGNCQVHFVVNSHILCKWHNILLHSLEKHFHDYIHPLFSHIYYFQLNFIPFQECRTLILVH